MKQTTCPRRLCALVMLPGVALCARGYASVATAEPRQEKRHVLLRYLKLLGDRHDVHFTIEEASSRGKGSNRISSHWVEPKMGESERLEDAIEELKSMIPGIVIGTPADQPKIVHLKEERLVDLESYAMDIVIDGIEFEGSPVDLVRALGEKVNPYWASGVFPRGMGSMFLDQDTPVRVTATRATARDILSNYLPLPKYHRVLWVAWTPLESPMLTTIKFWGPREQRYAPAEPISATSGTASLTATGNRVGVVWPHVSLAFVAGLVLGAAGAWLLLRRRSGG